MTLFKRYTPAKPAKPAKPEPTLATLAEEEPAAKPLTIFEQRLVDEAVRSDDFCDLHREIIGGNCQHFDVTKGIKPGDRTIALGACLLWQLVKAGKRIELVGTAIIVADVIVSDVISWVSINDKDLESIRNERRLLLICAESLQNHNQTW
jgi:hypothetical protein